MARGLDEGFRVANRMVVIMFVLELVDTFTPVDMDQFGIVPWSVRGLIGILFAPLLHGGFTHFLFNLIPLWVNTILLFGERRFRPEYTLMVIWIGSGMGTWLLGGFRGLNTVHIGASSLVFGLVSYLALMGIFLGRFWTILVSAVVIFCFGGIMTGVLPDINMPQISWESHLSGALVGALLAFYNAFVYQPPRRRYAGFDWDD